MNSKAALSFLICCATLLAPGRNVEAGQSYGHATQSFSTAPKSLPTKLMRKGKRNMNFEKISDINIVAATICAEAGGEPWAGKVMVGQVIANRAINSGSSPRSVCLAAKQFSCWNNRGAMELRMQTMRKHPAWEDCLMIAESICQPGYKPVSEATHYYAPAKVNPSWAKNMLLVAVVGGHRFMREKT